MSRTREKVATVLVGPLLFAASLVLPKKRSRWMFGAWFGERYADNSRFLFEHVLANPDLGVEAWWVTKNRAVMEELQAKSLPVVWAYSPRGLWLQLTARVFVSTVNSFDFAAPTISFRNFYVQLWHGTPWKAILRETWRPNERRLLERVRALLVDNYDLLVAPSDYAASRFAAAFAVGSDHIFSAGYPRCDALALSPERREEIRKALGCRDGERLWFYLPTHRQEGREKGQALRQVAQELLSFSDELESSGVRVILKPHFYEQDALTGLESTRSVQFVRSLPFDLYECLGAADGLVTDYSSVLFDFAALGRPIVLYPYDWERYTATDRHLDMSVESVSTNIARSMAELARLMVNPPMGTGLLIGECPFPPGRQSDRVAAEIARRVGVRSDAGIRSSGSALMATSKE